MEISESPENRVCEKHGAYSAKVVEIMGHRIHTVCKSCQDDEDHRKAAIAERSKGEAQRRRIDGYFMRSCIPPRFASKTFDDYTAENDGQQRALRVSRDYAENWETMVERGTCLILSGKVGTGKTHLACAVANAVIAQGHSALFATVTDALRSIKQSYGRDAAVSETDAINALVEPRLLVLDEVGMDYGTEHSKTMLFDLMNKRYENMRPSIILTNLDAAALREYFGDRIMDRLREGGGKLVTFTWSSHRS